MRLSIMYVTTETHSVYLATISEIEYGNIGLRDLNDTAYFWVMPIYFLIIFFGSLFFIAVFLTMFLFRKTYKHSASSEHVVEDEMERSDGVLDLKNK